MESVKCEAELEGKTQEELSISWGYDCLVYTSDTADELFTHGENEGLFYQLFASETGDRIGYGVIDLDSLNEDIERFEVEKLESKKKD